MKTNKVKLSHQQTLDNAIAASGIIVAHKVGLKDGEYVVDASGIAHRFEADERGQLHAIEQGADFSNRLNHWCKTGKNL